MKNITEEKILYHAFHNGSFSMISHDYRGHLATCLDSLLKQKFITWVTSDLWQDYKGTEWEDDYDDAWHKYTCTETGEVRLLIYRLAYAYKNHKDTDKHQRRIDELQQTLERYELDINNFRNCCSKNEIKAINDFNSKIIIQRTTIVKLTDDGDYLELSPYNIDPNWGNTVTNNRSVLLSETDIPALAKQLRGTNPDDIDLDEPVLLSMFNMSHGLGAKGFDATRSDEYVLRKINEELGEMTLEMNIRDGLSYKEAGKDGVKGEAVDLAICALDMFALQCDNMSPEEMEREFLAYMLVKLNKWRDTLK